MGYNVRIMESDCTLPKKNVEKAFKIMCALNDRNDLKTGGSYPKLTDAPAIGPRKDMWFAWMEWDYSITCKAAKEIFEALGFETEAEDNGDLVITYYDSKCGNEDEFFKAIGKLLKGSIEWVGEDGDRYLWKFGPKGMIEKRGRMVYK